LKLAPLGAFSLVQAMNRNPSKKHWKKVLTEKLDLLPGFYLPTLDKSSGPVQPSDSRLSLDLAKSLKRSMLSQIETLFHFADNGDAYANRILLDVAMASNLFLESIAGRQPELLRPLARQLLIWPALIGPKSATDEKNKLLLKRLEVAKNYPYSGKWNPKSPSTKVAIMMERWLQESADILQLPPLRNLAAAKQWFECGWEALSLVTAGAPEKNEFLRKIGLHREKHSEQRGQQTKATAKTGETNIRDGIRKQVQQSFLSLVGGLYASP
jgi:hypothetical protein